MGTSSSKPKLPKQTIEEAIASTQRQIEYRPSEEEKLKRDMSCLRQGKQNGFKVVYVDQKRLCFESTECARHMYRKK